jgi:hypothetical protein
MRRCGSHDKFICSQGSDVTGRKAPSATAQIHPFGRAKDFTLIVETALRDLQDAGLDVVDQAMFAGAAPAALV